MFRYAVVCGVMVGRVALTFRTASKLCRAGRAVIGMALQKDEEENNNRHGLVIAQNWEMRQPCIA
jgi:hypothetical protein